MYIIDTVKKSRLIILPLAFLLLVLAGCSGEKSVRPQDLAKVSQDYYQQAVDSYKKLIGRGVNSDKLHLALGQLYFSHGDFSSAAAELKQSTARDAGKLLAIGLYHLGNFTEAFEVFSKNDFSEDEPVYYYGLTCEKLNLFDQALAIYRKIKAPPFAQLAKERIEAIAKEAAQPAIDSLDPQIYQLMKKSGSRSQYPQAGALILWADERVTVTPDDKEISEMHYLVKILNERGKESFAETQLGYDSTYEKIELEYARTIKPDGSVVEVGSRHIRDVSKYLNFPLYSNARVYIISFPEITEGAFIDYKVKIYRNQLMNKKDFILSYPLQSSEPIVSGDFTLTMPKDRLPHIKILNGKYNDFGANLDPEVTKESENTIYRWQFKNIPQVIPEANMPPDSEINPTILLSTFNRWQEIYDWWQALAKDKIQADAAIKQKVAGLIRGTHSPEEKMRAIYNFCCQNIRYVAVEYGQAGYEPHPAADIFKNKYGDCKDQAILLVTMLREAGLPAWPVLISTRDEYNLNQDLPSALFNHCISATALNGQTIFLDTTATTCAFGDLPAADQNRKVLIFKPQEYSIETTPLYPAEHNRIRQELKIKLNREEDILAEREVFSYGAYDQAQRYWLLYTPPELISDALKEKIQDISIGSKLIDYDIKNLDNLDAPVVLSYKFSGPEYLTDAGSLRIMPQLASLDTSLVARDRRKYALDFGILDSKDTYLEIAIPPGFVIKYMPENISEDNSWLKLDLEYQHRDNSLVFHQVSLLKKNMIGEDEYPSFKAFFEGLAKRIKQRVILEKVK